MSKSEFTKKDIARLASLIKLELTEIETQMFAKEMEETIDYMDNLDELNTKNARPTYQTTGDTNRFLTERENERALSFKQAFVNTKNSKNHYFKIKGLGYSK